MTSITDLFGGVSIGQLTSDNIKLSLNGLAVKVHENDYVRYEEGAVVPVPGELIFQGTENLIYLSPVSANRIHAGDIIVTKFDNADPTSFHAVFAREDGHAQGQLHVLDPFYDTISLYSPRRNLFNMVFFVKVLSLVEELGIGTLGGGDVDDEILRLLPFLSGSGQSSNIWTMLAFMRMFRGRSRGRMSGRDNLLLLPLLTSQGGSADSLQTLLLMQALQEEEEEEEHGEHRGRREDEGRAEHEGRREDEGRVEHEGRREDEGPQPGPRRPTSRQQ